MRGWYGFLSLTLCSARVSRPRRNGQPKVFSNGRDAATGKETFGRGGGTVRRPATTASGRTTSPASLCWPLAGESRIGESSFALIHAVNHRNRLQSQDLRRLNRRKAWRESNESNHPTRGGGIGGYWSGESSRKKPAIAGNGRSLQA